MAGRAECRIWTFGLEWLLMTKNYAAHQERSRAQLHPGRCGAKASQVQLEAVEGLTRDLL